MSTESHTCKIGADLTVKIPPALAAKLGLKPNTSVHLSIVGDSIVVCPSLRPRLRLEDLLAGVTEDNLHGETDMGPPVGREIW